MSTWVTTKREKQRDFILHRTTKGGTIDDDTFGRYQHIFYYDS